MLLPSQKRVGENMNPFVGSYLSIEKQKPYFAMLLVQFAYAGMALISKAAMNKGMNPHIFTAYRQAFATIVLAPFAIFVDRKMVASLSYKLVLKVFFVSLFGITLSLNLYTYSLNYTSATFASATTNTIPAMTFVIAVVLRMENVQIKKKHGIAKAMGAVLSFSGALVFAFVKGPKINVMNLFKAERNLIDSSSMQSTTHREWVKGSLIMLLSNIAWSSWLNAQALVVQEYPAKIRLVTLQCLFSCLQSTTFAFAMEREVSAWKLQWDINLLSVAYCGVFVTGLTYWLQLWAVERKGPVFTAIFTPFALIITAIFSAVLWKEMLHLGSVCGAILMVGGLYCVLWGKNKEAEGEPKEKSQPDEENGFGENLHK